MTISFPLVAAIAVWLLVIPAVWWTVRNAKSDWAVMGPAEKRLARIEGYVMLAFVLVCMGLQSLKMLNSTAPLFIGMLVIRFWFRSQRQRARAGR